jgi:hypothetical protein
LTVRRGDVGADVRLRCAANTRCWINRIELQSVRLKLEWAPRHDSSA